ncbi:hypothetical protein K438DRAFT_1956724 [Mycena galopus ATCC 62051]|nr:hypothetical protein K438DRAFT_1956724 [Mycena galopus ATCC 62051]
MLVLVLQSREGLVTWRWYSRVPSPRSSSFCDLTKGPQYPVVDKVFRGSYVRKVRSALVVDKDFRGSQARKLRSTPIVDKVFRGSYARKARSALVFDKVADSPSDSQRATGTCHTHSSLCYAWHFRSRETLTPRSFPFAIPRRRFRYRPAMPNYFFTGSSSSRVSFRFIAATRHGGSGQYHTEVELVESPRSSRTVASVTPDASALGVRIRRQHLARQRARSAPPLAWLARLECTHSILIVSGFAAAPVGTQACALDTK